MNRVIVRDKWIYVYCINECVRCTFDTQLQIVCSRAHRGFNRCQRSVLKKARQRPQGEESKVGGVLERKLTGAVCGCAGCTLC